MNISILLPWRPHPTRMVGTKLAIKDQAKISEPLKPSKAVALFRSAFPSPRHLLGLLLPFCLICAACTDRASEAAEYAALGEVQLEAGNLEGARESALKAIGARDDVAGYFVLLGRIELMDNNLPGAFTAYSRALDLQADNLEILQAIAELGLQTDRPAEADEAADRILLLFPGSSRAMLVKGFLAIEAGRLEEAERFTEEIFALDPADEGGAILSARLQALQGNFNGAVATAIEAREAIGDTEALNATLLEIYRAQGNAMGMREVFPKVSVIAGEDSRYQPDFVNFLYKTGNTAAARAQAAKAIAAQPNNPARLATITKLFLEYDSSPFGSEQLSAITDTATSITRMALARFYFDTGQYAVARSLLARALKEGVLEAEALTARIALAERNVEEADRLLGSVLARDPRNPDALIARANRRLESRDFDGAIGDANIVASDAPQEYAGYVALAKAHLAKGRALRARQVFERGMDFLSQSEILAARYEEFLRELGDTGRIVSLYNDFAMASPSSAKAWEEFARVCAEFGSEGCRLKAELGLARAETSFVIDDPPGTPRMRGLFARITPEQICRSSGGVCTGL